MAAASLTFVRSRRLLPAISSVSTLVVNRKWCESIHLLPLILWVLVLAVVLKYCEHGVYCS